MWNCSAVLTSNTDYLLYHTWIKNRCLNSGGAEKMSKDDIKQFIETCKFNQYTST